MSTQKFLDIQAENTMLKDVIAELKKNFYLLEHQVDEIN